VNVQFSEEEDEDILFEVYIISIKQNLGWKEHTGVRNLKNMAKLLDRHYMEQNNQPKKCWTILLETMSL
jgi:hypothetical protein